MPFAPIHGLDLYYEVHGEGPFVLLVSGTGGDLRTDPTRAKHPLVRAGFTVAMYDQRGLGQTSKPDLHYTMSDYANDAAALLDHLGWPSAKVIGISFGGMAAQHLALLHPERVERLVLACTSSGGAGGASFDLLSIHDLPPKERLHRSLSIMDTRNDFSVEPPIIAPGLAALYQMMVANSQTDPYPEPGKALGARRQLEARSLHDTYADLPRLAIPTFVIGGRFDNQAPPENVKNLANQIPGALTKFFDGGHMFLFQDPSAWSAVSEFFGAEVRSPA